MNSFHPTRSTALPLLEAFHPDIFSHIFPLLTGLELCRMRRVNKTLLALTDDYFQRTFTIERVLSPFFNDWDMKVFRELQALTGAIIGGSAVVQFFGRVHYPESDLDVYSEFAGIPMFATLLEQAGYHFIPEKQQRRTFREEYNALAADPPEEPHLYSGFEASAILTIFTFRHPGDSDFGTTKSIQLMATRGPVVGAVLLYHSSCVMNIITYHAAYSFFPRITFHRYEAIVTRNEHSEWLEVVSPIANTRAKYEKRGWTFVASDPDDHLPHELHRRHRRVGDRHCWTIPLPLTSPNDDRRTVDSHQLNSWFTTNRKYHTKHCMRFDRSIHPSLRPVAYTHATFGTLDRNNN
ncbi:hypothetical protein DL96DRAFT_234856 [Flagelloscypha sp. PMI_526]|nr:hypothetical protein DL96DRAFT_234856 [Flagelloscypha sp. PMI_526]